MPTDKAFTLIKINVELGNSNPEVVWPVWAKAATKMFGGSKALHLK
jgi:hypothetical protein